MTNQVYQVPGYSQEINKHNKEYKGGRKVGQTQMEKGVAHTKMMRGWRDFETRYTYR